MPKPNPGPKKLAKFLERHKIPKLQAAKAIGVSHVTVLAWLAGRLVPAAARRAAIEVFTRGEVQASDWGLTALERRGQDRLSTVQPFAEPADAEPATAGGEPTGTEGA